MRGLAEFVMRGRMQAVMVAVFATVTPLFSWVGAAVVALVTLSKGTSQGAYIALWASLPVVVVAWSGNVAPMPVATLLGVILAAWVLRVSRSWAWALTIAVASGLLTGAVILLFGESYLQAILAVASDFFAQLEARNEDLQPEGISSQQMAGMFGLGNNLQLAGALGWGNAMTVALCLLLARWWQAGLYNPGGFRDEFQSFRLMPQMTVLLLLLSVGLASLGLDYQFWVMIVAVPFIFAGFSLVHALAAKRQIEPRWLVVFYIIWFVLAPVKILLLLAVVADSWLDLRARVASR